MLGLGLLFILAAVVNAVRPSFRLSVRYEATTQGTNHDGRLPVTITFTERARSMVVEDISVQAPVTIVAGDNAARYGHHVPARAPVTYLPSVHENKHLKAGAEPVAFNMLLSREGEFGSLQSVPVWFHMLVNRPVLSRYKKRVTVMIPRTR